MFMRISDLLTPTECEVFFLRITQPDKGYGGQLTTPSQYSGAKQRKRRDIMTTEECKRTLKNWVVKKGDTVYWDRVFTSLYKVGRLDVAVELAKNIDQDKSLGLIKSVEDLKKTADQLKSSLILNEDETYEEKVRQARDLNNLRDEDWDIIVERQQLPPYDRHLNEWCWSMVYGMIFGVFAAPLIAGLIFMIIFTMHLFDNKNYNIPIKIEEF
ncbi:transmembrane and death domain protein 1 [Eleutherodactylus coqui]|uniref:transmembrane and death domain protein 1 n=1 Tax=Eleutherodactylus coqui TaxID=57060 RepID=UPI00346283EF